MNRTPLSHCGDLLLGEQRGFVHALIPRQLHRRHVAARAVFVGDVVGSRRGLRVEGRAVGLDGERMRSLSAQNGRSFQWLPMSGSVPPPKSQYLYHRGWPLM